MSIKEKVLLGFEIFFVLATVASLCDEQMMKYTLFYLVITIIIHFIRKKIEKEKSVGIDNVSNSYDYVSNVKCTNENCYFSRVFLSPSEIDFYNKIKDLNNDYIIIPQVSLSSVVEKKNAKFRNELFKIVDFGIFTKNFDLLLLIELNDSTHKKPNRVDRDLRVQKILNDCNIKLIKFYTCYPNEKKYVINRILSEIGVIKK